MNARYPGKHQATRRALAPSVPGSTCARCGRPILPGQPWDLDHSDDRGGYLGAAHRRCNRAAGGRLGRARQRQRQNARTGRIRRMFNSCTLAVEISEDRRHTSIGAAAWLPDSDIAAVELAAYLDGPTAGVAAIVDLMQRREVLSVTVDPMGGAGTLLRPLAEVGV